ncbi:MAG TPA: glycosyl hydrolase [Polyangiales bacterium]|nr:glycosyl hydrolase [Polyangiales bacterium]
MRPSLALLLLLAVAASCTREPTDPAIEPQQPSKPQGPPGVPPYDRWPGINGKSGVNGDPLIDRASVEAFCKWRGRSCGVAHVYTDRKSWHAMTHAGWMFDNMVGFRGQLIVSQGLVPEGHKDDLPACARGEHDQDFRDFGNMMVLKGRGDSIVRLGWEFNGDFMSWAATDAETWKQCYRRAALAIRESAPRVKLDWTINAHGTPSSICGGVSTNCYPGDDVVDIIGIDNYDMFPSAKTKAEFDKISAAPDGLTWTYQFAKRRGKKFSVGEWGIAPGAGGNSSGENPEFIRWMHEWFAQHADDLVYEAYFNSCEDKLVESNMYRPVGKDCGRQNHGAASLYKELFGGEAAGGDALLDDGRRGVTGTTRPGN